MTTPNERLRQARERKYESAADAARALNVPIGTYAGHENGHRGFPAKRAPAYARKFGVSEEWLLYGKGDAEPASPVPSADDLARMISEARDELAVSVPYGDWPRAVASILREQLLRYVESGLATGEPLPLPTTAPGKAARSRSATKPDGPA